MQFHHDENVDHAIAEGLRRRGIDVTTSTDADLIGTEDEVQLSFATGENRVIVTHDHDFLRLNAIGVPHAGIAYCPPASRSVGEVVRQLLLIHECLDATEMKGRVEHL